MASEYAIRRLTPASRWGLAGLAVALAVLVATPLWGDAEHMRLIVEYSYYVALAQMWNLLAGYSGLVSVGQQAFVGLGSYMFISLTVFLSVSPFIALPLAAVIAALIAVPSALLLFRLQGSQFAIGTWALAEVFRLFFTQVQVFGAGTGLSLPIAVVREISPDRASRDLIVFYLGLAAGLGSIAFVFFWLRSRSGLALTAIRDSNSAAASIGINQRRIKMIVYVVAAAFAGLVGGLIMLQKLRITPSAGFSVADWSANVIFIVVIGGLGSIEGPIVGAIVFFLLRAFLADFGSWYLIALGSVAIVVMLRAPRGLWGYVSDRFDIQIFPTRYRVVSRGVANAPSPKAAEPGVASP
jgi:branched-chain amino acid transport system permease protein